MSATPTEPIAPRPSPPVIDRVPQPKGLLPRHAQTWVLLGLAAVMILIIAFTGQSAPPSPGPGVPPPPAVIDPNETRIQEYRNRIDEQARRLAAEQAELALAKRALSEPGPPPTGSTRSGPLEREPDAEPTDAFAQDLRQREYRSLFADNLALTLREPAARSVERSTLTAPPGDSSSPSATPQDRASAASGVSMLGSAPPPSLAAIQTLLASAGQGNVAPPSTMPPATHAATASSPTPASSAPAVGPSPGSDRRNQESAVARTVPPATVARLTEPPSGYERLLEGTIIETVLTTRLNGAFAGPVSCLVTTPVYSRDYQRVLMPRGSRLLGSATPVAQIDQQRLAVTFHRVLLPNGQTVPLDRAPGLTQAGQTGLQDQVDHHYASIFAATLAVGAIAGLAQVNTRLGYDAAWTDAYRQGVSGSVSQSSLRILDRFLNRLPTVTIREGTRVKVYLTGDLDVPVDDDRSPVRPTTAIR